MRTTRSIAPMGVPLVLTSPPSPPLGTSKLWVGVDIPAASMKMPPRCENGRPLAVTPGISTGGGSSGAGGGPHPGAAGYGAHPPAYGRG